MTEPNFRVDRFTADADGVLQPRVILTVGPDGTVTLGENAHEELGRMVRSVRLLSDIVEHLDAHEAGFLPCANEPLEICQKQHLDGLLSAARDLV